LIYGIAVDPHDPACPNFTPNITEQTQANPIHLHFPYPSTAPTLTVAGNSKPFLSRGGRMDAYGISGRGGQGRMECARRGGHHRGGGTGGHGRGRMGGRFAAGPRAFYSCPNCG
jgi:hypothetical protein